jgi:hypothetical protein
MQFLSMRKHAHKTVCMNGANRYEHGALRKQRENANACGSCESCEATEQLALYSLLRQNGANRYEHGALRKQRELILPICG